MFAMASLGARIDKLINKTKDPYVFRVGGHIYHDTGSLLPPIGKKPQFTQLYIYDTDNGKALIIDQNIVEDLSEMFDEHNQLVRSFRRARDRLKEKPETYFRLHLPASRSKDCREYNIFML